MLLRPRQKLFVERSLRALDEHGNALGVAPNQPEKGNVLSGPSTCIRHEAET